MHFLTWARLKITIWAYKALRFVVLRLVRRGERRGSITICLVDILLALSFGALIVATFLLIALWPMQYRPVYEHRDLDVSVPYQDQRGEWRTMPPREAQQQGKVSYEFPSE
jgi:hypothetical protein